MRYISIPSSYVLYEADNDIETYLADGRKKGDPAIVVMEILVLSGKARRVGTIGTVTFGLGEGEGFSDDHGDEDDDDEAPTEGLWPGDDDVD